MNTVGSGTGGPGSGPSKEGAVGLGTAGSREGRGGTLRGPSAAWAPPGRSRTPSPARRPQNASQDLLGEALAQHIRQQMSSRAANRLFSLSLPSPVPFRGREDHGMSLAIFCGALFQAIWPGGRQAQSPQQHTPGRLVGRAVAELSLQLR